MNHNESLATSGGMGGGGTIHMAPPPLPPLPPPPPSGSSTTATTTTSTTTSTNKIATTTSTSDKNSNNNNTNSIPTSAIAMKLLDMKLKPSSAIIMAISGEFTGPKQHEICIMKPGGTIEIYRIIIVTTTTKSKSTKTKQPKTTKSKSIEEEKKILENTTPKKDDDTNDVNQKDTNQNMTTTTTTEKKDQDTEMKVDDDNHNTGPEGITNTSTDNVEKNKVDTTTDATTTTTTDAPIGDASNAADEKKEEENENDEEEEEESDDEDDDDEDSVTSTTLFKLVCRIETRSILRSICAVRFPEEKRDVVAVGSDSGTFTVLDFQTQSSQSKSSSHSSSAAAASTSCTILHSVPYGKTGIRRIVPGQYIASDPKGRAVMISAIEKRKLVYVLNRNHSGTSLVASPLEANRSRTITYALIGLDNGYDNPIFASIEGQYPDYEDLIMTMNNNYNDNNNNNDDDDDEADEQRKQQQQSQAANANSTTTLFKKQLAYYELDLGLNHVSRKWAIPIPHSSCCMVAVPGGVDGPGGVLLGTEDYIEYYHNNNTNNTTTTKFICVIPRRKIHPPNKGILITSLTMHRQKKYSFFALAQSELGDVYKVSMEFDTTTTNQQQTVIGLHVALLDTVPTGNSLCVSRNGMLFIASEFGNHPLYQFLDIDLVNAPTNHSSEITKQIQQSMEQQQQNDNDHTVVDIDRLRTKYANELAVRFVPTTLKHLRCLLSLDNPSPTTSILVGELAGNEVSPQMYTLTGRGPCSALSILRHGSSVTELAVTDLPGVPGGIYTVADNTTTTNEQEDEATTILSAITRNTPVQRPDRYIVISFADATLVLSIGATVEEVGKESGFLTNAPTLACSALGTSGGGICQVHPSGVRQIHSNGQAKQWNCPGLKRIECASVNTSQVLIALAGGEVIYFDFDSYSGNLNETAKRDMGADVCCLDIGMIQSGKSRSYYAAIGCRDQTIKIVSLEPGKILQQRSSTALKSRPHSVVLLLNQQSGSGGGGSDDLTLVIGLDDGSTLRTSVDPITGAIGTTPTRRFLGARPVAVSRITFESQPATLLLSSRPWMGRHDMNSSSSSSGNSGSSGGKYIVSPLSFAPLDHGCSFRSNDVPEGIVATSGQTLRILSIDTSSTSSSGSTSLVSSSSSTSSSHDDVTFNTKKVPLRYTPRQMTLMSVPVNQSIRKLVLIIVESDYNEYGYDEKISMGFDPTGTIRKTDPVKKNKDDDGGGGPMNDEEGNNNRKEGNDDDEDDDAMDMDEGSDDEEDKKKKKVGGGGDNKATDGNDDPNGDQNDEDDDDDDDDDEDDDDLAARQTVIRGPIPPLGGGGKWGSCIRLLDPSNQCVTLDCTELNRNEAALCCTCVRFHSKGGEPLLAVGTVTNLSLQPFSYHHNQQQQQQASGALKPPAVTNHILLYRILNGERLQLLHRTLVTANEEDKKNNRVGPILAMAHFQGRLLVGFGQSVRLYELGKKQLLRKCEIRKILPTGVKTLQTVGDRAYVGDLIQSIRMIQYDNQTNQLTLIATDPCPRPIVCQELLDWNTIAIGDKFGNISILRLPRGAIAEMGSKRIGNNPSSLNDPQHQRALWDATRGGGSGGGLMNDPTLPKFELLCHFYVGEVITSMTRSSLVAGGPESLIYVTVSGRIGSFVPFTSRSDVDFYTQFENILRCSSSGNSTNNTTSGTSGSGIIPRYTNRHPQQYRSYYAPVMHIIDGDLCDSYNTLPYPIQKSIAEQVLSDNSSSVNEIYKKLEDTRNGLL